MNYRETKELKGKQTNKETKTKGENSEEYIPKKKNSLYMGSRRYRICMERKPSEGS